MKRLVLLSALGLMSVTANASNWILANSNPKGDLYIDIDSITSTSSKSMYERSYRQAFLKYSFNEMQEYDANQTYDTLVVLTQFDCESNPKKHQRMSILARNDYKVVAVLDDLYSSKWQVSYPDTPIEIVTEFVCSY